VSERLLVRAAAAALLCVLVAVLVHAGGIVHRMHSIPDYVSPLALAHDAGLYPDTTVVLGNFGWFPGFWGARAAGALPLGDQLASGLPLLLMLAVVALLAAQAWRLWGALPALVLAGFALSMGSEAWVAAAAWSARATSWWALALAGVTVVAAAGGRRRAAIAGAAATVLWGGLCLSGDKLVYAVIVAPLAATAVAAFARGHRGLALQALGLGGLLVASGVVFGLIADGADVVTHAYPVTTVPYDQFGGFAGHALNGVTQVWSTPGSRVAAPTAGYVATAALLGALSAIPALLRDDRDLTRTVWVAFWTAATLGNLGAFVINATSVVGGLPVTRYLYALPLAGGAVLAALVGGGRARRLAPAAVAVACVATTIGFFAHPPERNAFAHTSATQSVLDAARERGLTRGFGSYQTVYPMAKALDFAVPIDPVGPCAQGVCPFLLHRVEGAYRPQSGIRSFLLVDRSPLATPGNPDWVTEPPAGVQPVETVDVGDGLQMLVYDHDVARDLGPPLP
jgi:hypothetical protein